MRSASRDSTRACGIVRVPCRHSRATLRTFETVVQLIGHTRTAAGLRVKATLDTATYPTGVVVTRAQMNASSLHPHDFRGEWNYELRPRRR